MGHTKFATGNLLTQALGKPESDLATTDEAIR
jgi:hypothetical protein